MPVVSLAGILQFPLYFKQFTDATAELTVVDGANNPITDPTGWTARAQIRSTPWGLLLFEWNTSPGTGIGVAALTYSPGTNTSTLALTVTKAETALFTWGSALWDCYLTDPTGLAACVVEGTVAAELAITQ